MDSKLLITFETFRKLVLEDREDLSLTCKVICHTYGLGMWCYRLAVRLLRIHLEENNLFTSTSSPSRFVALRSSFVYSKKESCTAGSNIACWSVALFPQALLFHHSHTEYIIYALQLINGRNLVGESTDQLL